MATGSLLLNILVLVPVCLVMLIGGERAARVYGSATPARGILLALYLTILVASVTLLWLDRPDALAALLAMQVLYKGITPFTVGTWRQPVVISNLLIAAFHAVTLSTMSADLGF